MLLGMVRKGYAIWQLKGGLGGDAAGSMLTKPIILLSNQVSMESSVTEALTEACSSLKGIPACAFVPAGSLVSTQAVAASIWGSMLEVLRFSDKY